MNQFRHDGPAGNGEVLDSALRLSAKVRLRGYAHIAHRVMFNAKIGHSFERYAKMVDLRG
jgi:hypothetical protein